MDSLSNDCLLATVQLRAAQMFRLCPSLFLALRISETRWNQNERLRKVCLFGLIGIKWKRLRMKPELDTGADWNDRGHALAKGLFLIILWHTHPADLVCVDWLGGRVEHLATGRAQHLDHRRDGQHRAAHSMRILSRISEPVRHDSEARLQIRCAPSRSSRWILYRTIVCEQLLVLNTAQ